MKILTETSAHNETIVSIIGEFDALGCQKTKRVWQSLANHKHQNNVVLELSEVTFLDSSGVGTMVFLFKKLRLVETSLMIAGATGQVKELLTLLRIEQAIPVYQHISDIHAITE